MLLWIIKTCTYSLDLITSDIVFVDLCWTLNLFGHLNNQDKFNITEQKTLFVFDSLQIIQAVHLVSLWKTWLKIRITIPSCVEQSIRNTYTVEDGVYDIMKLFSLINELLIFYSWDHIYIHYFQISNIYIFWCCDLILFLLQYLIHSSIMLTILHTCNTFYWDS